MNLSVFNLSIFPFSEYSLLLSLSLCYIDIFATFLKALVFGVFVICWVD